MLGILAWLAMLISDIFTGFNDGYSVFITTTIISKSLLIIAIFSALSFYRYHIGKAEIVDVIDLIWKVFVTGLITVIASLITRVLLLKAVQKPAEISKILITIINDVNIGLIIVYLAAAFMVWKRLILYQKSKSLIRLWKIYEIAILVGLFFTFSAYGVRHPLFIILLSSLGIFSFILSANLKWVAYLNYKQKWKSILLIALILLYIWYFFETLTDFSARFNPSVDLVQNVSILAIFAFVCVYSIFSILVLLFNLPTSSNKNLRK